MTICVRCGSHYASHCVHSCPSAVANVTPDHQMVVDELADMPPQESLKSVIANVANEVRRIMAWRAPDIKGENEAEEWFDSIIKRLEKIK